MKYMFIRFNRYNGANSSSEIVENDNVREDVLKDWLDETLDCADEEVESELKMLMNNWNKDNKIWCCDGEEMSELMIPID